MLEDIIDVELINTLETIEIGAFCADTAEKVFTSDTSVSITVAGISEICITDVGSTGIIEEF